MAGKDKASRGAGSSTCAPPSDQRPGEEPAASGGLKPALEELFLSLIRETGEFVVVLDRERRLFWSNPSFRKTFPAAADGIPFGSLLTDGSARALEDSLASIAGKLDIELHHPVPGGVKIASYCFVDMRGGLTAGIGIDRSHEMEVVSQLAVLVEELEREINQRIDLAKRLEEMAVTDPLTGLFNRRRFDEILGQEWKRWARYQQSFSLQILDIDRFKSINDTFGHLAGDEALKTLAGILRKGVRVEDSVARYGGEEFALILLGTPPAAARDLAERLRARIAKTEFPSIRRPVTVSIGVATPEIGDPRNPEDLIRMADEALYRAKQGGRDRVELAVAATATP